MVTGTQTISRNIPMRSFIHESMDTPRLKCVPHHLQPTFMSHSMVQSCSWTQPHKIFLGFKSVSISLSSCVGTRARAHTPHTHSVIGLVSRSVPSPSNSYLATLKASSDHYIVVGRDHQESTLPILTREGMNHPHSPKSILCQQKRGLKQR